MIPVRFLDDAPSALCFMLTVMAVPAYTKDILSPCRVANRAAEPPAANKTMGGSTQTDDRLACVHEVGEVLGVFCRWLTATRTDNHQIGRLEFFPSPNACLVIRVDIGTVIVPREQDFAVKTMVL